MALGAYIVTIADRLYRVCGSCGISQPHFVRLQVPQEVMTVAVAEVITACCACQRVHSTASIDGRGDVTTS